MQAEPGFSLVTPGSGVIMCPPVSVCHQVSTTGQRPLPNASWYQRQTSGLMGSPTVPRMRNVFRWLLSNAALLSAISILTAVGAV